MAWLRIVTVAMVFAAWRRPWRVASRLDRRGLSVLAGMGLVLAATYCFFYIAVERLPLSTVDAIELLGTVVLATLAVWIRRTADLVPTTVGIAAITPIRFVGQPLGFAFGNCAQFMAYVVLRHRDR